MVGAVVRWVVMGPLALGCDGRDGMFDDGLVVSQIRGRGCGVVSRLLLWKFCDNSVG